MMKVRTLTLSIGGFFFRVNFFPSESILEKTLLTDSIKLHLGGFNKRNPGLKYDYIINIVDERHMIVLSKGKNAFVHYYIKTGVRQLTTFYTVSLSQFNLIILMALLELLEGKGFLIHASGNLIQEKVNLFIGDSGAGKSTIAKLLSAQFPIIADDSLIIRKEKNEFYAYQSPLIEKNSHSFQKKSIRYSIGCCYAISKTKGKPRIMKVKNTQEILPTLLKQLWTKESSTRATTKLLFKFARNLVGFSFLAFPKNSRITTFLGKSPCQQDIRSHPAGTLQPTQVEH